MRFIVCLFFLCTHHGRLGKKTLWVFWSFASSKNEFWGVKYLNLLPLLNSNKTFTWVKVGRNGSKFTISKCHIIKLFQQHFLYIYVKLFSDNVFILQTEALSNVWPLQGLLKETNNNNWILYLERGQKRNNEWLAKVAKLFIKQHIN